MSRALTPQDAHALMNLLVKEATGQDSAIQVVDTNTFVSAGETVLATGIDNVLNSLSLVLGRTFMAVRPYNAKLNIINAIDTDMYSNRLRKISFYSRQAQASGDFNTNLYTNFAPSYDNGTNSGKSTATMWEQNQPVPLELNFAGSSTWEDSTTIYEYQLKNIFRGEDEFNQFVSGIMTEKANDIESQKEAFNRMTLLNYIAGIYDLSDKMSGSVINLTAEYNAEYGTSYTTDQLMVRDDFYQYFVYRFKLASDYLTNRSANYHWSPDKTIDNESYVLLRHTPRDRQRVILYEPMFTRARASVFPEIFNPSYLDLNTQYEGVNFWQNVNNPAAISVTPAVPNTTTGVQEKGAAVALTNVVGVIFDEDALMVDYQLDSAATTPLEARKHYRNMWWSFARNAINDFTENGVIFIMQDAT